MNPRNLSNPFRIVKPVFWKDTVVLNIWEIHESEFFPHFDSEVDGLELDSDLEEDPTEDQEKR